MNIKEKECCKNCRYRKDVKQWDYSKGGCEHRNLDGFVCAALSYEGVVIHMIGADEENDVCEMYQEV